MTRLPRSLDELRGLRAAHWARESTGRQAERFGPEAQREQRARAIERHGLVDTGIAWAVAHSGRTIAGTEQWADMLARAGRDYDVLVVGYVSRFARDLRAAVNARHDLHQAGAALLFADERLLSSDEDAWESWAREAVEAEAYSRRLAKRIREGYAAKRRRLADPGGQLPLGFARTGPSHTAAVDPDTMPVAQRIWTLAASGVADGTIAAQLDLSLWTVRGVLRSPLYGGHLQDGTPTHLGPVVAPALLEQALEHRRTRTRAGHRSRYRVYPLTGGGPLVCAGCGAPIKGDTRTRRRGRKERIYRHTEACEGWTPREVAADFLERQVAELLAGAKPNRESSARIRAALGEPLEGPDRLALARIDARLRELGLELVSRSRTRSQADVLAAIAAAEQEREQLAATPADSDPVAPEDALRWLGSLRELWEETDDEGRRALVVGTFARLGAIASGETRSHRIVDVEVTPWAERRGIVLALPTSLGVTLVGDTGAGTTSVTPRWHVRIAGRSAWLRAARASRRSA